MFQKELNEIFENDKEIIIPLHNRNIYYNEVVDEFIKRISLDPSNEKYIDIISNIIVNIGNIDVKSATLLLGQIVISKIDYHIRSTLIIEKISDKYPEFYQLLFNMAIEMLEEKDRTGISLPIRFEET